MYLGFTNSPIVPPGGLEAAAAVGGEEACQERRRRQQGGGCGVEARQTQLSCRPAGLMGAAGIQEMLQPPLPLLLLVQCCARTCPCQLFHVGRQFDHQLVDVAREGGVACTRQQRYNHRAFSRLPAVTLSALCEARVQQGDLHGVAQAECVSWDAVAAAPCAQTCPKGLSNSTTAQYS